MVDQIRAMAVQADGAVGHQVPAEAYKAWSSGVLRNPRMKDSFRQFCAQHGVGKGQPIRVRSDYRYSRVGFAFDALGAPQTSNPPALYSIGIGGTDPVLGTLTETDTNVLQGGKQDSSEMFIAYKHGFTLILADNPNATPVDTLALLQQALLQNISAKLETGTQTDQRLPPLYHLPGIGVGYQNGGAAPGATTAAATQGAQSLIPLNPPVMLGAGEAYRLQLLVKQTAGPAGATYNPIPTIANANGVTFAIAHIFYGQSFTGIAG